MQFILDVYSLGRCKIWRERFNQIHVNVKKYTDSVNGWALKMDVKFWRAVVVKEERYYQHKPLKLLSGFFLLIIYFLISMVSGNFNKALIREMHRHTWILHNSPGKIFFIHIYIFYKMAHFIMLCFRACERWRWSMWKKNSVSNGIRNFNIYLKKGNPLRIDSLSFIIWRELTTRIFE